MFVLQERHQRSDVSQRVNKHKCLFQQITSHVPSVDSTRLWCAFFRFYTQTSFLMNNAMLTKTLLSSAFFVFLNQVIGFLVRSATCFSSALSSQVRWGPADARTPTCPCKAFRDEWNVKVSQWGAAVAMGTIDVLAADGHRSIIGSSNSSLRVCSAWSIYLRSALTFTSLRRRRGPPWRGHRSAFIHARAHVSVTHAVARGKQKNKKSTQLLPGGSIGFGICVSDTPAVCKLWPEGHLWLIKLFNQVRGTWKHINIFYYCFTFPASLNYS